MDGADILGRYQEMLELSQQMLAFARNGEWEQLAAPEKQRSAIVLNLMKQEDARLLDKDEQAKKGELIRDILAADAEIMTLTESWLGDLNGELRESLHGELRASGNEDKLKRVYGTS